MQTRRRFAQGLLAATLLRTPGLANASEDHRKRFERLLTSGATSSMQVLINDMVAFEYGDVAQLSYVASARKSLIAMIFGPSVESGKIDLELSLASIGLTDIGGLLPEEQKATIRDLLTARSGVYHGAANLGDASDRAPIRGTVRAGSYFLYNNWDFNALGSIFQMLTGRTLYEGFEEDIADPIGLQDWRPDAQPIRNDTGLSQHPARHFVLSTRDMARLGQLMLQHGSWKSARVLPSGWVKRTTSLVTAASEVARTSPFIPGLGYGYLWWVFDSHFPWTPELRGAYTASGANGQFITVVPRLRMVVAHKTVAPSSKSVSAQDYFGTILPAALQLA